MNTPTPYPECALCLQNGLMKGDILAQSDSAFAIVPHNNEGCYLIIPTQHAETLLELPDNWWSSFKDILSKLPDVSTDYNLSLNYGKNAGQTAKHLHFWIIKRSETGKAAGKGLARLIDETNQE